MSRPGDKPPSDPPASASDPPQEGGPSKPATKWRPEDPSLWGEEEEKRPEWRPESPEAWGETEEGRPEWRPESPETWERIEEARKADSTDASPRAIPEWQTRPPRRHTSRRSRRAPASSKRTGVLAPGPAPGDGKRTGFAPRRGSSNRHHRRPRRAGRHRFLKWSLVGVGVLLAGALLLLGDAYYQLKKVADPLEEIRGNLSKARGALSHGRIPEGDPFTAASGIAQRAQEQIAGANFAYRIVGHLPLFGRPMTAIRQEVAAAGQWAQAASTVRDIVSDLLGPKALRGSAGAAEGGAGAPVFNNGVVNVKLISALPARLQTLIGYLETADAHIRAIPSIPFYHRLSGVKSKALAESTQDLALARNALSASRLLPSFLGADRPKRYFLALQNNSDLRGTGGAVLAYAFLDIDNGKLNLVQSGRIGELDDKIGGVNVHVPGPVYWYITHAHVAPRLANGANYSPNLALVGQAWSNMIEKITGKPIDGAIALDPVAVATAMGNRKVRVRSYPTPISAANAVKVIENQQYNLPKDEQAAFPGDLIGKAWAIFRNPQPFVKTIQQLAESLREKHIQIWSANDQQQALLNKLRWGGQLTPNPGDYLDLVDNKRVANKVDYYSHQKITYRVKLGSSGIADATYQVQLTNLTPPNLIYRIAGSHLSPYALNRAMMSLYVPERAQFKSVSPATALPDYHPAGFFQHVEDQFRVFTQTIDASPGHPGLLTFHYVVPGAIQTSGSTHTYELTVQHQPLLHPADFTVVVTLPAGSAVTSASGWRVLGNVATYHATLTKDVVLRILY